MDCVEGEEWCLKGRRGGADAARENGSGPSVGLCREKKVQAEVACTNGDQLPRAESTDGRDGEESTDAIQMVVVEGLKEVRIRVEGQREDGQRVFPNGRGRSCPEGFHVTGD